MKMPDDELMDEAAHATHTAGKGKEHKLMTMADVSERLQENFADEIADAKEYLCMARIADHASDEHDCHYLLEMAKDELTHAMFIHDFMERHGIDIPEEQEECFGKLKEEMAEFF